MMNEFLRKRRKEILVIIIKIDDSLAQMKRDNYLLLRRAKLFFHRETFFLAQKCKVFTFLARMSKVLLSSKHISRAFLLFGGSMILVKEIRFWLVV